MPRYVILEHDHPALHWDLMLECGDVLRTWCLAAPPEAGKAVSATASFDHRLHYLDYEGPVSGNRGTVKRWDHGTFEMVETAGRLELRLNGTRLKCVALLGKQDGENWELQIR
jgi:hypothetical protein